MTMFRYQALFFLLILLSLTAFAQIDDPVNVDTAIVRVNIGVVNKRGQSITSLDRSNFKVFEDGVKQEISHFELSTAPFSVVMMLDMSGSTKSFRQNIALSAARFLDALAPEDRVSVIEFYSKVNVLNDFTTDRRTVLHSISAANGSGDTNLYKGIEIALERLAKEGNRRKAIVVLTDGVDTKAKNQDRDLLAKLSGTELSSAIKPEQNEALNKILDRSDKLGVTIYPLALPTGDPAKLADPTPLQVAMYSAARSRLKLVADRTGGTLNSITRLDEMGRLYALIAADLRTLYTLEYQPANPKRDGKWRTIRVEVSEPELIARSRQGYFAR
ncbi:MAG: VWA domain-containing protein [Pyrinomonadaceae bacterium]|nr:VWA domain-containing protein [Blastocatellia bacterium]MCW5957967.1 VWA domain-containing protein [Pyrinomonadaceae bacterium]